MSVRRPTPLVILVAFVLAIGASAHAQFGNLLKKRLPSPGTPAAAPEQKPYCSDITDEMIDRFLKALKSRRAALDKAAADEKARQEQENTKGQAKAQQMVSDMMKFSECTEAVEAKDSRTTERDRLQTLSSAAYDKGDDKTGEKYDTMAQAISNQIGNDSTKACAHLQVSMDKYESAEERAASEAAADAARRAKQDADKNAAKSGGFSNDEFAKMLECTTGRLNNPTATPTTPDSAAAIDQRADELRKALGQ